MNNDFNVEAAKACLVEAVGLIAGGVLEDVLRHRFSHHLPLIFTEEPSWVTHHGIGTEYHLKFAKDGRNRGGFVDSLVGLTAIEYEKDLSQPTIFTHGLGQIKDYCAGLLNAGHPRDLIIGVLSDTVRWYAYRISSTEGLNPTTGQIYGRDHVLLEQLEMVDLQAAGDQEATRLGEFLARYLGREGARPLGAEILARDLGFESPFCRRHIDAINGMVDQAFQENEKYARLIERLWADFVAYLGDNGHTGAFDRDAYVREVYILTLAKLLCANIILKGALTSDDPELRDILNGDHFKRKGLLNLVEFDYFGWLNTGTFAEILLPIAREIQDDLRAYDFRSPPAEDLFGATMAQLARETQRLLLGQEWTPAWLAAEIVRNVFSKLPEGEDARLVDMCCGSGTMVVEAVKLAKKSLDDQGATVDEAYVARLAHAITGFDIDPLAVMLAKVGWVIAARDRLEPFGTYPVSIPIYHADSLFAATPLAQNIDDQTGTSNYDLILDDDVTLKLPGFLVSPERRALFDSLLSNSYELAMASAKQATSDYTPTDLNILLTRTAEDVGAELDDADMESARIFVTALVVAIEKLSRDGRNGIWAFVLRNSFRPGLVVGLFNGLVTNPPWLALSKVADNPYKIALRIRAENRGIKPPGSSHLHIELATIFLLHSVDRYLQDNAQVGCVLPETILNGHHHNPFRQGAFLTARSPVPLLVEEIWRVENGTFKNEAVVLFGKKAMGTTLAPSPIPGQLAATTGLSPLIFNKITQGQRIAWSDKIPTEANNAGTGFFNPAEFRQGVDLMPRTVIFHEVSPSARTGRSNVKAIDRQTSSLRYLVGDAKRLRDFALPDCVVPNLFLFEALLSNHLTPFDLAAPAKALLPFEKNATGQWRAVSTATLAAQGVQQAFAPIFAAIGDNVGPAEFFEIVDTARGKLTRQSISTTGWLVFYGAGGGIPCAAYASATRFTADKLIVDQTLYWVSVTTEEEAIYLTGALNSQALDGVIKEFQPRGAFKERHVHKLPLGVTPPYNPDDAAHLDVVEKTHALLADWRALKIDDPEIAALLDPNNNLARRRTQLRAKLRTLATYEAYEVACRNLYGL